MKASGTSNYIDYSCQIKKRKQDTPWKRGKQIFGKLQTTAAEIQSGFRTSPFEGFNQA